MAQPWIDAGFEAWCFDGQHEPGVFRDGLRVNVGMWFDPDKTEAQRDNFPWRAGSISLLL